MKLPDLRTFRGAAFAVCAAVFATVVVALAIPLGVSGGDSLIDGPGGLVGDIPTAAPEDLSGFVNSERWGISLDQVLEEVAADDLGRRGLNPALRRMGFLGLIEIGDVTAVLLADPEIDGGVIIELGPGDTLPDGRVLTAVTDNSITLTENSDSADPADVLEEVLLLFPRAESDPETGQDR